jgi:hypothetical protein
MGLLYGRAGRLNTKNAGFRPGQSVPFRSGFGIETPTDSFAFFFEVLVG